MRFTFESSTVLEKPHYQSSLRGFCLSVFASAFLLACSGSGNDSASIESSSSGSVDEIVTTDSTSSLLVSEQNELGLNALVNSELAGEGALAPVDSVDGALPAASLGAAQGSVDLIDAAEPLPAVATVPTVTTDSSAIVVAPEVAAVPEIVTVPEVVAAPAVAVVPTASEEIATDVEAANTAEVDSAVDTTSPDVAAAQPVEASTVDAPDVAFIDTNESAPQTAEVNPSQNALPVVAAVYGDDPNPNAAQPAYKSEHLFPTIGTALLRATSNAALGVENGIAVHAYSRRQAWNMDGTLLDAGNMIVDANTLDVFSPFHLISSRNWSNTNPDLIIGTKYVGYSLNELASHNVRTGEVTSIHVFTDYNFCLMGDGEGNISNDDRYVALACRDASGGNTLVTFDMATKTVLGQIPAASNYNWVGFSQSGKYVVVENHKNGDPNISLVRYEPDLSNPVVLTNQVEHGDLGVDINGDDVFVMISWDYISYFRLKDGVKVNLGVSDIVNHMGHGHLSCRNIKRPGYCYFSTYGPGRVGLVKIGFDENQTPAVDTNNELAYIGYAEFQLLGFHKSTSSTYESQPKASVNPDGTKVIVSSDWYGLGEINDYIINIPQ